MPPGLHVINLNKPGLWPAVIGGTTDTETSRKSLGGATEDVYTLQKTTRASRARRHGPCRPKDGRRRPEQEETTRVVPEFKADLPPKQQQQQQHNRRRRPAPDGHLWTGPAAPPPGAPTPDPRAQPNLGLVFLGPPSSRRSVAAGLSARARARAPDPRVPRRPPARPRQRRQPFPGRLPGSPRGATGRREGQSTSGATPAACRGKEAVVGFLLWRPLAVGGTATKCC